jgi:hypothetical protein
VHKRGIILSDPHCGNIGGLVSPEYFGDSFVRPMQEVFWKWYIDNLGKYGPFDFVLGMGDYTDGEGKKGTLDTLFTDVKKQAQCAASVIREPGVDSGHIFLVRGTPFHSNGVCEYEDAVAEELGCSIKDCQKLNILGWNIHTRHVVGRSDISYGQATPILKELARMEHEAFIEDKDAPDITLRGHVHYSIGVMRDGRQAHACPCLCLPIASANGRRYTAWYYTVGFSVLDLYDDREPVYTPVKMDVKLYHDDDYEVVDFEEV